MGTILITTTTITFTYYGLFLIYSSKLQSARDLFFCTSLVLMAILLTYFLNKNGRKKSHGKIKHSSMHLYFLLFSFFVTYSVQLQDCNVCIDTCYKYRQK